MSEFFTYLVCNDFVKWEVIGWSHRFYCTRELMKLLGCDNFIVGHPQTNFLNLRKVAFRFFIKNF